MSVRNQPGSPLQVLSKSRYPVIPPHKMTEPHPTRVLHHGNHHMTPVTTRQTQKRTLIIYLKMRQQQRHRTRADRRRPFYAERRSVSWMLGPVPQGNFLPSSCSLFTCRAKSYRQTSTTAIRNHATRHSAPTPTRR